MTIDSIDPVDPLWHQLRAEIEQFVQLESAPLELGNRDFTWYRAADPDSLLEAALTSDRPAEEVDPFWAGTWRAARGLDRFLGRLNCHELNILELGCGSGQAGIGAAARGAQVLMTDAVSLALKVAQLNAWPVRDRVQFQIMRWTRDRLPGQTFPVIIGSDLVYDPKIFSLLEQCAREHLAEGGKLLLSEPHRHTGDKFAQWIVEAGWRKQEHTVDLGDQSVPIRIFECSLAD